jgi:hypothetical protein
MVSSTTSSPDWQISVFQGSVCQVSGLCIEIEGHLEILSPTLAEQVPSQLLPVFSLFSKANYCNPTLPSEHVFCINGFYLPGIEATSRLNCLREELGVCLTSCHHCSHSLTLANMTPQILPFKGICLTVPTNPLFADLEVRVSRCSFVVFSSPH